MNSDIRIKTNLPQHPKVTKLRRIAGDDSFRCLIQLWCQVAMIKPSGDISCWDEDDIEIAADWQGERGAFYAAVTKVRLIDIDGKSKTIHDWAENNPWAVDAEVRSLRASKNQVKRWCIRAFGTKKEKTAFEEWYKKYQFNQGDNTTSILAVYEQYTSGNTPSPSPSPSPLPSPSPSPKDNTLTGHSSTEPVPPTSNPKNCPHLKIVESYNEILGGFMGKVKPDLWKSTRKRNLAARWRESKGRQSVEWWNLLFLDIKENRAFLTGQNDRGWTADLGWIVKLDNFTKILEGKYKDKKGSSTAENTCQTCANFCAPSSPDECHKSATKIACKDYK